MTIPVRTTDPVAATTTSAPQLTVPTAPAGFDFVTNVSVWHEPAECAGSDADIVAGVLGDDDDHRRDLDHGDSTRCTTAAVPCDDHDNGTGDDHHDDVLRPRHHLRLAGT